MELTYKGRAKALLDFYNSLKDSWSSNIFIGGIKNNWGSSVASFNPAGMIYTLDDKPKSLSSLNYTVAVDARVVSSTAIQGASTVTYNGATYYQVTDTITSIANILSGNNNSLLLYLGITITPGVGATSVTNFTQFGFGTADNNIYLYENIPSLSLQTDVGFSLTFKTILAF